jgi:hypothetical protein
MRGHVLFSISTGAQGPQIPNTKRTGWVLRFDGMGPVRVGMTVNQVNAALGESFSTPRTRMSRHVSTWNRDSIAIQA